MLRKNLKALSPIPEEGVSSSSPCNVRKNEGGREHCQDCTETNTSSHSVGGHGEDVEASGEDENGSPEADSSSPEDVWTPEAMRRLRKPRLTDIIPFGRREHSIVKDVTPPAGILAMDLSVASADSPNSPLEGPVATSSPYQRPSREPDSPLPELVIEVETKRFRRDSDSEDFFNRLENTMGKLARKYILNEEDDTWSFDSGVQIFENSSRNYFDAHFTEGNVNVSEASRVVERVASDSRVESKDAGGMINRKKKSEVKTSEGTEMSKRTVLKDITPPTRKLTLPRIASEEVMKILHDQGDYHRDRSVSMHSSGVLEEEKSSNDETFEHGMEEHTSESLIQGEPEDEDENYEEALEEEVERSGSDKSTETTSVSMHSSGELEAEEHSNKNVHEEEAERSSLEATGGFHGKSEEEEDINEEEPVQKEEQSASDGLTDAISESEEEDIEEKSVQKIERNASECLTGESEEKDDSNEEEPGTVGSLDTNESEEAEEEPVQKVKRSVSAGLTDATGESEQEEDKNEKEPVQKVERSASEGPTDATGKPEEEEDNTEDATEEEVERSALEAKGESAEEEENSEEALEEELERSTLKATGEESAEEEEEENSEEAPEEELERSALKTTEESEDEESKDEDAPKLEVEQSQSESIAEVTGKLEEEESNAVTSQEAVEQRASESHAVKTDALKEPEIISSPDIRSPEAMRRRRSSKITMISPVEKSKYSELKVSTPPARTLSVQLITDEGLIQHDEDIGEEADIGEEKQEEEEQATISSFARTSDANTIFGAAPSKYIQWKSSLEDIDNYLESSEKTSHAQKIKRIPTRDLREGADTERSFKRRRIFENRQSKEATDLDEIAPLYPIEDPNHTPNEKRKDSVEAFISPATTPTKERVSPIIATGRSFVTRRRARIAMVTQSCSPLSELNIEVAKKYPEADSDSEEFFNRLEKTMTKLARKYILKIEDDTESFDSGVQEFERLISYEDALDSDDD